MDVPPVHGQHEFRVNPWPMVRLYWAVVVLFISYSWIMGEDYSWVSALNALVFCFPLWMGYVYLIRAALTLQVSAAGLHGHSLYLGSGTLKWDEIESAKRVWILLPYAMLKRKGKWQKIWLLLCIERFSDFVSLVRQCAPATCPLVEVLEEYQAVG